MPAAFLQSPLLIAGLSAGTVLLLALGLMNLGEERRRRRDVAARLRGEEASKRSGGGQASAQAVKELFARIGDSVKPRNADEISRTRLELIQGGCRGENAVALYWGARCGLALGGSALFLAFWLIAPHGLDVTRVCFLAVAAAAVGAYLPPLWLRNRVQTRRKGFQNGLPDALDLLVVCVEAGMSLDSAIHRVGAEMQAAHPVVGEELKLLTLELRAGKRRRDALKSLALRVGLDDVNSLVALLIQADMFGTSVAQTLRVYSEAMRSKRYQRAEEQAAKLPVKMLFPMTMFIFPALLLVLMGPAFIRLMSALGKS